MRTEGQRSRGVARPLVLLSALCSLLSSCSAQAQGDAETAYRTGNYEQAIEQFRKDADAGGPNAARARRGLVRALAEVGRYAEAEEAGRKGASAETQNALGEVLAARGRLAAAESAFTAALAGRAADSLDARLNLAVLRWRRGETEQARRLFDSFISVYNSGAARLTSEELAAVATACRYLGRDDPQLFKDALRAFDRAIAADTLNVDARVALGEMFLEKYNSPDAQSAFDGALRVNPKHPRALLGVAKRLRFDGDAGAAETARKALATNTELAEGHTFLATLLLESEDYEGAEREAGIALGRDPASLEALSVLAAARYFRGDRKGYDEARERALALNPRYAEIYATLAELAARNRFYGGAVTFANQAVALDPKLWRAWALLGANQLRVGKADSARRSLETAFAGDPYDVWTKNTLDLLDTFKDYTETRSPRFQVFVDGKESPLLAPYVVALAEEAFDSLEKRYGYRPPTPVRLELYRSHADFSVRTTGLAGLGALGVAFGSVLAMDSPSARPKGEFNWGSTLWHELAHTFTLGATDHRVPRWVSEGLSVLEERRARVGWGAGVTPSFLAAYRQGRLLPVSRLNDGFMHPTYPEQIMHAYYQASLVMELIERDFGGMKAIRDFLGAYKDGQNTEQAFQRALRVKLADFDQRFDAYLKERFAGPLAALRGTTVALDSGGGRGNRPAVRPPLATDPESWQGQMRTARTLYDEGKYAEAVPRFERAKQLFPEYAGDDSPYWFLAQIHKKQGNLRAAANELAQQTARNESHYAAYAELAELREQLGDLAGAAAALEGAIYIHPYDPALHDRLASLYARSGNRRRVVRERQAVLALAPVDRAEALYQLALAHYEAGEMPQARRTVLQALETAPNFDKAQELLLKLQPSASK